MRILSILTSLVANEHILTYNGTKTKSLKISSVDGEKINFGTVADSFIDKNTLFMKVISVASAGYVNIHGVDLTTKLPWSSTRQSSNVIKFYFFPPK